MVFIAALSALLVFRSARVQDLSKPVTYRTVAVPASRAIADLAKATHVDLGVNAPLDREPLILRFQNVPLQDAMDKIAAVLHGAWIRNQNSYTLQRTDDIEQLLEQAVYQERLKGAKEVWENALKYSAPAALDASSAEAFLRKKKQEEAQNEKEAEAEEKENGQTPESESKPLTDAQVKAQEAQEQAQEAEVEREYNFSAEGRLKHRVMQAIDPSVFASSPNRTIVFSTNPKPFQYQLQMSDDQFQALIGEQNTWTYADKRVNPDNYGSDDDMSSRHIIDPGNAKVMAMVSVEDGTPGSLSLYIVDTKDKQLIGDEMGGGDLDRGTEEDSAPVAEVQAPDKLGLPVIKLSPLSNELISLTDSQSENGADLTRSASNDLHDFLLDAPDHDPLSLTVSEVLLGCADAKNLNLVACPPDNAIAYAAQEDRPDQVSGAEFMSEMAAVDTAVSFDNGWLTIQSKHPLKMEAERTDRASLSAALKAVDEQGYISIDTIAEFAAANSSQNDFALLNQYLSLCHPELTIDAISPSADLRFYGLLSDDQRQALFNGNRISMDQLSAEQAEALIAVLQDAGSKQGGDANGFAGEEFFATGSDYSQGQPIWSSFTKPQAMEADQQASGAGDAPDSEIAWDYTEYLERMPDPAVYVALATAQGDEICAKFQATQDQEQNQHSDLVVSRYYPRNGTAWVSPTYVATQAAQQHSATVSYASCPTACIQLQVCVAHKFTATDDMIEHRKGMTSFGPAANLPDHVRQEIDKAAKAYQRAIQENAVSAQDDSTPQPQTGPPPPHR